MKLFVSSTSVFVRKVRIVVREKGLTGRVEEIATVPVEAAPDLVAANPISQLPALIDDDGNAWADSSLIAAWLDTQGESAKLLPDYATDAYWRVRRVETAASGMNEMMARIVYENRRPENERSPFWLKRWEGNLMRAFAHAETLCPAADAFDMGALSLGVAATFCDFRLGHVDWRGVAPKVAACSRLKGSGWCCARSSKRAGARSWSSTTCTPPTRTAWRSSVTCQRPRSRASRSSWPSVRANRHWLANWPGRYGVIRPAQLSNSTRWTCGRSAS